LYSASVRHAGINTTEKNIIIIENTDFYIYLQYILSTSSMYSLKGGGATFDARECHI